MNMQVNEIVNLEGQRALFLGGAKEVAGLEIEEMLVKAGLDWEVETSPIRYGEGYAHRADGVTAAYRSDTGRFIDVYRTREVWQNSHIVENFDEFCREAGLTMDYLGSLRDGDILFAAAKVTEAEVISKDDVTSWWLILKNGHKNGHGLQVALWGNRCWCTNGCHSPVRQGQSIISHVGEFNSDRIKAVYQAAINSLEQKIEEQNKLAEAAITPEEATIMLINAFGDPAKKVEEQPKAVQTMLRLFGGEMTGYHTMAAYNTAYGLLQSVTEYYNWMSPSKNTLSSLMGGSYRNAVAGFERQLVGVCC